MSNEEESLLALLCESLSNGQRGNAPIFRDCRKILRKFITN